MGVGMSIFECTTLSMDGIGFVVVRVPESQIEDRQRGRMIMALAERDWSGRRPILMGCDTSQTFGHPADRRLL